jgi:carboxypeptidase PM20D1
MMRTTCAFTMMEGSKASNVIPPAANVRANIRLIGGDTAEGAVGYLKSTVKDPSVKFRVVYSMSPSPVSKTEGKHWDMLTNAISQTWPGAAVSPYLMLGASDSRHYCRISDGVYRFSPMPITAEERASIHGNNERVTAEAAAQTVKFYIRLMRGR